MTDLPIARSQMAMVLAFHIIFAAIGIGMPLFMAIAEGLWLRTRNPVYLTLTKRWATGTAILFAVGAVSGTIVSFDLGLLWPGFMRYAGAIIGMPFSLEGFAFFTEAIFLGIYLYGWNRISPRAHWLSGVLVALSGVGSGIFVVTANAWMNTPAGFSIVNGLPTDINPIAAMFNPSWFVEALHMTLAAYLSTAAAVAGIHAFMLLRDSTSQFHRKALGIVLGVLAVSALLQLVSGDLLARFVAVSQPIKLAALEGQFQTEQGAPLRIGGLPDPAAHTTHYALEIPYGLSILAFHDPNATVQGLNDFPSDEWPEPLPVVHIAFQVMVAAGTALAGVGVWGLGLALWRKHLPDNKWLLRALVVCAPLGFLAIEAGWTVTEVGRQPWVIYKILRTADAVTPVTGLMVPFITFMLLYLFLGFVVAWTMLRQVAANPTAAAGDSHASS